ncbi:Crp/Fnr family transcriptional regulator [Streptomyces formicae]|uniref:Crp/Fnr family transcriptional regulator n=1 Tax=Streptomyces formicae TaxID=1616117 RepID=A0ABY3WEP9_9ACTN|nr:Crp/Fnr family transcriptional regulator [Streptomyces formicae]UNM10121.1 Crp/Fnr family transcriptional regulator [Streptomyces formicae]
MVPEQAWRALVERGRRAFYRRGSVIYRQGEDASSVVLLEDGTVKVLQVTEGGSTLTLTLRGPGEVLGEMGVILDRPRSATLKAVSHCSGSVLGARVFLASLDRLDLVPAVYRLAVDRMQHVEQLRTDLVSLPPAARVARVIQHLALEVGRLTADGILVELGMSREELAAMAAVGRSTAAPALKQFHEQGVLDLARTRLVIRDMEALEGAARAVDVDGPATADRPDT